MNSLDFDKLLSVVLFYITKTMGIPIVRGPHPSTDGKSVFLPKVNELLLSARDVVRFIAYVYHEAFHVLYTNFKLSLAKLPPFQRACVRVLEDIRIEGAGSGRYPAAKRYLKQLVKIFTEDGLEGKSPGFSAMKDTDPPASVLQFYMLYRLRHDVLRQTDIAPALVPTVEVAKVMFPRSMMVRLDALMYRVVDCESTDDVFSLAKEIAKMVEEEQEKQEQEKQRQQQQQADDDTCSGDASGDGDGSGQDDGADSSSGAKSGQDDGDGDAAADAKGSASSSAGDSASQTDAAAQTGASDGAGGTGTADLGDVLGMSDDDIVQTLDDMLEQVIGEVAEQHEAHGSAVSMPNQHKLQLRPVPADMAAIRGSINRLRTDTLSFLEDLVENDWESVSSGSVIDTANLYRVRTGGDVFLHREEGIEVNAAVSMLIDRSGSMHSLIGQATNATLATILAYDIDGVSTQVSVFPAYGTIPAHGTDEGVAVVKSWDDAPSHLASCINSIGTSGGTPMAEAILFAATDIYRREESLKLVIVATDGEPNDPDATRQVIDVARKAGITIAGLGIGVDPSPVFGKQFSAELKDVGALAGAMVKLVGSAMTHVRH